MTFRSVRVLMAVAALTCAFISSPPVQAQNNPEWTRPFPPFKLIGNIYWVGSYDLSTYLDHHSAGPHSREYRAG